MKRKWEAILGGSVSPIESFNGEVRRHVPWRHVQQLSVSTETELGVGVCLVGCLSVYGLHFAYLHGKEIWRRSPRLLPNNSLLH